MKFNLLLATAAACMTTANALIPIEVKGNRFVKPALDSKDDGEEFTVIGIDYQPGGSSAFDGESGEDVLSNEENCLRDAYVLQQLGVNTIRVYTVSPWTNHDKCMSIFNAAGIYVILDVNSPSEAPSRTDPDKTYSSGYLNRVFGLIDAFKGYPNVLGLISGNEVVNDESSAKVVPKYMRAIQRDMKQYISKHANRTIPVGYSAADDVKLREAMWMYLQCGDEESRSDFYGLNSYDWCSGRDDWQSSGYGQLESTFESSSIPVFLSEYGCNVNSPRTFDEVNKGLYAQLGKTFSGGLVYEYSQEESDYGLVEIQKDGSIKLLEDFDNLQKAYNQIKLNTTAASKIEKRDAPKCDKKALEGVDSSFQTDWDLPKSPGSDMIKNGGGNKNVGKIVDIGVKDGKLEVKNKVYNSQGQQLKDTYLKIDKDNEINKPSGSDINTKSAEAASSSSSSSGGSSSSSSKGDASVVETGVLASVFAFVAMFI